MKKSFIFTYATLLLLTLSTVLMATLITVHKISVVSIMGISAIKFLLVAFQFMELKKGNSFWKIILTTVLVVITSLIILIH